MQKHLYLTFLLFICFGSATTLLAERKPWLGVQLGKDPSGVMLNGVFVGSAAEKGGMQPGDIVTHIDGTKVGSPADFTGAVKSKRVGQSVKFDWIRKGKAESKSIALTPKPNETEMLHDMHMGKKLKNYNLRVLQYEGSDSDTKKSFWSMFKKSFWSMFSGKKAKPSQGKIVASNINISQFAGKPLILKFWATWCPACLSTHGKLNTFARQATNVPVLAITDEEEAVVRKFIQKNKPAFRIVVDHDGAIRKDWPFSSIPVFAVADKDHKVRMIEKGAGSVVNRAIATARRK